MVKVDSNNQPDMKMDEIKKMTMRERMLSGISKATNRIIALDDLIQDASSLELRQELQQERRFWQDVVNDNNEVLEDIVEDFVPPEYRDFFSEV